MLRFLLLVCLLVLTSLTSTQGYGFNVIEGVGMYKVGSLQLSLHAWGSAFDACIKAGPHSHLAIIDSVEEANALRTYLANQTADFFYIGFSDLTGQGKFMTVQGTPLSKVAYNVWYGGSPSGNASSRCGAVTRFVELTNQDCEKVFSYICEMPLWSNYEYVENLGYYKFYTDGMTWQDAENTCRNDGAHLLVVDNKEEYQVLMEFLKRHPSLPHAENSDFIHYGVHDYYEDKVIVTVQGDPFTVNTTIVPISWGPMQPVSGDVLNVAQLNRIGELYMSNPTTGLAFICEYSLH